jgi:integrase/recombinase XerD
MILLAALAGLRVHEIAKVRGEDIDTVARTLRVTGKGGKVADLPLHPLLVEAANQMPHRGIWFPGNSRRPGQPIHRKSVSEVIQQAMFRADIPGGTAHRLRHWYGSTLVGDGGDLRTAQTLMRHVNLNTTAIYVVVPDEKRIEGDRQTRPVRGELPAVGIRPTTDSACHQLARWRAESCRGSACNGFMWNR